MGRRFARRPRFSPEESDRIVAAIRAAEAGSRGEVRVHVEGRCRAVEPLERAREVFEVLGMRETAAQTGVLLYAATEDRVAVVYAGEGVHGAAAQGFWDDTVAELAAGFSSGRPTEGIVAALGRVGELLRTAAPGTDAAGNELPDGVTTS